MLPRFGRLAILAMLLAVSTAGAAPPDAFEPFDLKYLPRGGSGTTVFKMTSGESRGSGIPVLIAVRPAAFFNYPAARKHAPLVNELLETFVEAFGYRGKSPGIENTESIVLRGWVAFNQNPESEDKPAIWNFGMTGGVIRTVRPFDWPGEIRLSFPDAAEAEYRDAKYLAVKPGPKFLAQLGIASNDRSRFAFYCPDGRTLVYDSESGIRDVIDRVMDGKSEPPPGWAKVERSTLAIALDIRGKQWLQVFPRTPGPHIPVARSAFFNSVDDIILGVDTGPTTRFHLLWSSSNQFMARKAQADSFRSILFNVLPDFGNDTDARRTISPSEEAVWIIVDALLSGRTTRTALGSEYVGIVPDDLIHFILRMVDGNTAIAKQAQLIHGDLAVQRKHYDTAIALMNDVIRTNPNESEAWQIRGSAYC
ncbi:MAG TPA: hypothetical protein VGI99_10035, partial [Gemmataceae bacterium]